MPRAKTLFQGGWGVLKLKDSSVRPSSMLCFITFKYSRKRVKSRCRYSMTLGKLHYTTTYMYLRIQATEMQWVRAFAPQAEGWLFKFKPQPTFHNGGGGGLF